MSDQLKEPKLMRDWKGREVELRRPVETKGGVTFEAGTRFTVCGVGHAAGFALEEVGGERRSLSAVPRVYVRLVAPPPAAG
jgi:hypothetical protein